MKPVKIFAANGGRFIDPIECGSTVGWHIEVTVKPPQPEAKYEHIRKGAVHINADMSLSDCHRRIMWALDCTDDNDVTGLEKLDAAIAEMQTCRAALATAFELYRVQEREFGTENDDDEAETEANAEVKATKVVKPMPA